MAQTPTEHPKLLSAAKLVVPDSIEPVLGWKALRIRLDGQLESPQQGTIWPAKKRIEASCDRNQDWGWKAIKGRRANLAPAQLSGSTSGTVAVTATAAVATFVSAAGGFSGGSMHLEPSAQPQTLLPPGWSWSWEPTPHEPAKAECSCGIYIVSDPRKCSSYLKQDCVLAEIALWGNVVPAAEGARGQFAYPQKLYCLEHLADVAVLVADLYGVPLEVRRDDNPSKVTKPKPKRTTAELASIPPPAATPPKTALLTPSEAAKAMQQLNPPPPPKVASPKPGRPKTREPLAPKTVAKLFVGATALGLLLITSGFMLGSTALLSAALCSAVTMLTVILSFRD